MGVNFITVPPATISTGQSHVLVVPKNTVGLGVPGSVRLVDQFGGPSPRPTVSVSAVTFLDTNPAESQIGGVVRWQRPPKMGSVTYFSVFLSVSFAGNTAKLQVGTDQSASANSTTIRSGTPAASFTTILVYTGNDAGLQERPAGVILVDQHRAMAPPLISVSSVLFRDVDPDLNKVSGTIRWTPMVDPSDGCLGGGFPRGVCCGRGRQSNGGNW